MSVKLNRQEHRDLIVKAFNEAYPRTTITSARVDASSLSSSLHLTYVNGPPEIEACKFIHQFDNIKHDAVTDTSTYTGFTHKGVQYYGGISFLFIRREYSEDFVRARAEEIARQHGLTSIDQRVPADEFSRTAQQIADREIAAKDLQHVPYQKPLQAISFAELKRRLNVGTIVQAVYHKRDNGADRVGTMVIAHTQTNSIAFGVDVNCGRKNYRWLSWDRGARGLIIHSERSWSMLDANGVVWATYTIMPPGTPIEMPKPRYAAAV